MSGLPKSGQAFFRTAVLVLLVAAAGFVVPTIAAEAAEHGAPDPFALCIGEGADPVKCLNKLGHRYNWSPTETACRFVGGKVEAIIAAGGDARWRDLFYNERCVRLGLPHSGTAAEPGDNTHPHPRFSQCMREIMDASNCWDILGRHSENPGLGPFVCSYDIRELRDRQRAPNSKMWVYAFGNERCWRLGLPHYEWR